jgi:hypothetical protein
MRAAVVAFTNFFAHDVYTDDGSDFDESRFHSFADVSGDLSDYFMFVSSEGTLTVKDENAVRIEGLRLERYTKLTRNSLTDRTILSFAITITVSLDVSYDGNNYIVV